jgi:hypothetical protein
MPAFLRPKRRRGREPSLAVAAGQSTSSTNPGEEPEPEAVGARI